MLYWFLKWTNSNIKQSSLQKSQAQQIPILAQLVAALE